MDWLVLERQLLVLDIVNLKIKNYNERKMSIIWDQRIAIGGAQIQL